MPTKVKKTKKEEKSILEPKEVVEETEAPEDKEKEKEVEVEETPTEEPVKTEVKNSESDVPKVTSFSQLDTKSDVSEEAEVKPEVEAVSTPKKYTVEQYEMKGETSESLKPESTEGSGEKKEVSSDEIKEWLKEVRPDTSKEVEKSGGSGFKIVGIVIFVLVVAGLIFGGFSYYKSKVGIKSPIETGEQETTPSETPVPTTEVKEVNFSELTVNVLNGSGIAGEAGKAAKLLDELKFKKVETGNAGKYDYTTTVVSLKKDMGEAVYEKVKEKLSASYIVEKDEKELAQDSSYDIVITVGAKKPS